MLDASSDQVLFSRKRAGRASSPRTRSSSRPATALARFGPADPPRDHRLVDRRPLGRDQPGPLPARWGRSDPDRAAASPSSADRVAGAGVTSVQGPLRYDDTFLDRVTTIPQHGIRRERIGTLSALTIDRRPAGDPARTRRSASRTRCAKAGVSIGNSVTPAAVPLAPRDPGGRARLSDDRRPRPLHQRALQQLLRRDAAQGPRRQPSATPDPPRPGSPWCSASPARADPLPGENGSGLSRRNRASPAAVVRLLDSMLEVDPPPRPTQQLDQSACRDAWVGSAGGRGQERHARPSDARHRRRRATATRRRARSTGVSALSGYCFRGGRDDGARRRLLAADEQGRRQPCAPGPGSDGGADRPLLDATVSPLPAGAGARPWAPGAGPPISSLSRPRRSPRCRAPRPSPASSRGCRRR